MADYSTTAGRILILFAGDFWARRQLSNSIRYVSFTSELRKSLSSVEGVLGIKLAILYSMADYSTTTGWIMILFVGGCWARCQLLNAIRYVSFTSNPMKSLSSVEGVLGIKLVIFYLMADYSTTAGRILILFAGGLLGSLSATQWYMIYLFATFIHDFTGSRLGGSLRSPEGGLELELEWVFWQKAMSIGVAMWISLYITSRTIGE